MNAVPDRYLGVWQRRRLSTADGLVDTRSTVLGLQTPRLHADLRLPAAGAAASATCLEACSHEQLLALAGQQGFAGLTRVEDDLCCWQRLMDYQPCTANADIGLMRFESSERLIEDALDDSYREIWERLPESLGPTWGQWLRPADGSARQACLLVAGDCFFFAAERAAGLRRGGVLADHLRAAKRPRQLELLAFELSFGRIRGAGEPWRILHSSLPGRAGQHLLPAACSGTSADSVADFCLARLGAYPPPGGWARAADPAPPAAREAAR